MSEQFKFDFDFGGVNSDELMEQTKHELISLKGGMDFGKDDNKKVQEAIQKTEEFFESLQTGKFEFPEASPTVFPLNADYFKQNNLPVPKNLDVLSAQAKFFWLEFPMFLVPGENPFYKLQLWMGFAEGMDKSNRIPKVHSAFPDTKFAEYAKLTGSFLFGLSPNLAFNVGAGINEIALPANIPMVQAKAGANAKVDAKIGGDIGFAFLPWSKAFKRALVECKFAGEQVLWTITDKQSLEEDNPIFVVILQVPEKVDQVQLEARAQAHRLASLPMFIMDLLDKISPKSAEWLKKGGPQTLPPRVCQISTK